MANDPTRLIQATAESYARVLGEEWEDLSAERQQKFRVLSYHIYTMHCTNKLAGIKQAVDEVDDVLLAPSTPKRWLPGVQEAKNSLIAMMVEEMDTLEMRVAVPDGVPDDLEAEDPHSTLEAGVKSPYGLVKAEDRCGLLKPSDEDAEYGWTCTRPKHPDHWLHWDDESDGFYDNADGEILVTWHSDGPLESIHMAVIEYEDGE